ncbi:hypothetical protein J1N35_039112 [Gossypium stocksii]|uniref:RNase H type-1 domain-containing protein n=1 Tax=Gossypium stocksii TaxID=47602 RepID=A0A9D3UN60_9ROSI|nr:hypothetical protein J1N35_039112 [Gossypium stocksii]
MWPLFCENLTWSIGDGSTIRGWKDTWIPNVGPLFSYVFAHDRLNLDSTLKDWVLQDGSWNVDMLRIWLPGVIIRCIVSIPPPHFAGEQLARAFGNASAGGVVRDRDGNWILGFTHYLGRCSPLEAELWSILDGILILLNKGYKRDKIQTENLEVVRALSMEDAVDSCITLLRRVK